MPGISSFSPSEGPPWPFTIEKLLPFLEFVFPLLSVLSLDLPFVKDCKLELMPSDSPRNMPSTRLAPLGLSTGCPFSKEALAAETGCRVPSVDVKCGGSYGEVSLVARLTGSLTCLDKTDGIFRFPSDLLPTDSQSLDFSEHVLSQGNYPRTALETLALIH